MYLDVGKVIENAAAKIADNWAHVSLDEATAIASLVMEEEYEEMVRCGIADPDETMPAEKDENGDWIVPNSPPGHA